MIPFQREYSQEAGLFRLFHRPQAGRFHRRRKSLNQFKMGQDDEGDSPEHETAVVSTPADSGDGDSRTNPNDLIEGTKAWARVAKSFLYVEVSSLGECYTFTGLGRGRHSKVQGQGKLQEVGKPGKTRKPSTTLHQPPGKINSNPDRRQC